MLGGGSLIDALRQIVQDGFDCDIREVYAETVHGFPDVGRTKFLELLQHGHLILHLLPAVQR